MSFLWRGRSEETDTFDNPHGARELILNRQHQSGAAWTGYLVIISKDSAHFGTTSFFVIVQVVAHTDGSIAVGQVVHTAVPAFVLLQKRLRLRNAPRTDRKRGHASAQLPARSHWRGEDSSRNRYTHQNRQKSCTLRHDIASCQTSPELRTAQISAVTRNAQIRTRDSRSRSVRHQLYITSLSLPTLFTPTSSLPELVSRCSSSTESLWSISL